MLAIAILCCLAAVSSASYLPKSGRWPLTCNDCEYDTDGIGYIPHDYCRNFIQCEPIGNGQFKEHVRCCAKGTFWDQRVLTCIEHLPLGYSCTYPGIDTNNCNETTIDNLNCNYTADPNSNVHFYNHGIRQSCAPGTKWDQDNCTCIHGGMNPCNPDLLVDFQFNAGPDQWIDSSCNKIPCFPHGNAHVVGSSMVVNGKGDYCEFSFLKNIFIDNPELHEFTIEILFTQDVTGFNQPFEGLFGNGDCNYSASVVMETQFDTIDHFVGGELVTTSAPAVWFGMDTQRVYTAGNPHCMAMTFDKINNKAEYFLDGSSPGTMATSGGEIDNTQVASTIGMSRIILSGNWCEPIHFHGEIDRVLIWKKVRTAPDCIY